MKQLTSVAPQSPRLLQVLASLVPSKIPTPLCSPYALPSYPLEAEKGVIIR